MYIQFQHLTAHNFLSLGDVQVGLDDNNLVLIKGINANPLDQASSNGSGKTSLFNAICWALTGETISGNSSDIVNLYGQDGCFVTLTLTVNQDHFIVTRSRDYLKSGSDLKISKNGKDISGKGIRESTKVLVDNLGELNSELIGSIIILGQGLPHRFSNNTPSGRKELLEKLSKSDFMIEDIKERLLARKSAITKQQQVNIQQLAAEQTYVNTYALTMQDCEHKLQELQAVNFEEQLEQLQATLEQQQEEFHDIQTHLEETAQELEKVTENLSTVAENRQTKLKQISQQLQEQLEPLQQQQITLQAAERTLQAEIGRIDSITDVCPTCGQKLVGVVKPSTEGLQKSLVETQESLQEIKQQIKQLKDQNAVAESEVNAQWDTGTLKALLNSLQQQEQQQRKVQASRQSRLQEAQLAVERLKLEQQTYQSTIKQLEDTYTLNSVRKQEAEEKVVYYTEEAAQLSEHLDAINQMNTIVKRDFRGYLLSGVITYMDQAAKRYAKQVFGIESVDFTLEGNNINITYNKKPYENLSGGEKQKVDIIIQFALKDMLSSYLNVYCNILVLDEIFDNLDVVGCQKVLNLVSSLEDVSSIYIISHHADELQIAYDKQWVVRKDSSGISSLIE